jgi:hypothetical protein
MEMQQMIELLLKEIKADRKADKEERKNEKEEMEAKRKTDKDFLAKLEFNHEQTNIMLAKLDAYQEKTEADRRDLKEMMKMMDANHGETVAYQEEEARPQEKERTPVDTKPEAAEERQVPEDNATVMPVEEPKKKRRRDRRLAAERRRHKQRISTQESRGPPKELAVARRGTTCREKVARKAPIDRMSRSATVAWRKRNIFRKSSTQRNCGPLKEVTASRMKITCCAGHKRMGEHKSKVRTKTIKKLTFGKRLWKGPECNTGIRDQDLRQHLQGRYEAKDLGGGLP